MDASHILRRYPTSSPTLPAAGSAACHLAALDKAHTMRQLGVVGGPGRQARGGGRASAPARRRAGVDDDEEDEEEEGEEEQQADVSEEVSDMEM